MIPAAQLLKLLAAIAVVESNVNDAAIGDGGDAHGRYQIHRSVVRDVNASYLTSYHIRDAHDPVKAERIALLYLWRYTAEVPNASLENAARIWNGGPDGWRESSTLAYWHKVHAEMVHQASLCQPTQLKLLPGGLYLRIPGTDAASSSQSGPVTFYFSVSNASAATGRPSASSSSTISPSGAGPARRPASRPRKSRPAKTR